MLSLSVQHWTNINTLCLNAVVHVADVGGVLTHRWPWRSRSRSWRFWQTSPWKVSCCRRRMTVHPGQRHDEKAWTWLAPQAVCLNGCTPLAAPIALTGWQETDLEVQCSLVGQISLVPGQSYYNVRTGLSLELFHPVLRPHKRLLATRTGREGREGEKRRWVILRK